MNILFHKKGRIACVIDYFDDDLPWNYIERTGDGHFEAIATHLVEAFGALDGDEAREHSVGVFDDHVAAIKALHDYLARVRDACRVVRPDGTIDLNKPTIH